MLCDGGFPLLWDKNLQFLSVQSLPLSPAAAAPAGVVLGLASGHIGARPHRTVGSAYASALLLLPSQHHGDALFSQKSHCYLINLLGAALQPRATQMCYRGCV